MFEPSIGGRELLGFGLEGGLIFCHACSDINVDVLQIGVGFCSIFFGVWLDGFWRWG